jgi:hypothetical protein
MNFTSGFFERFVAGCKAKARLDALEEAAQVCEHWAHENGCLSETHPEDDEQALGAEACARAIRQLAGHESLKETGT